MSFATFSRKLSSLPYLDTFLGHPVKHLHLGQLLRLRQTAAVYGWGYRPSTRIPRILSKRLGIPFINLEDGFLRSYAPGRAFPTISLVVDHQGIYYAGDRPSDLESLLSSDVDLLKGAGSDYALARERILAEGLSKYNHAPDMATLPQRGQSPRVLIVDQTVGDASVTYGLASASTFTKMVAKARRDNPHSTLYIKTHPEVSSGAKRGYLSDFPVDDGMVMLRDTMSPSSLLQHVDKVYTVTSHLGFEALLRGLPVHCFGLPWYSGWGNTHDAITCARRTRQRSIDELFAAAYLHYSRYLDPETGEAGTIFDAIDWLCRQRDARYNPEGRTIAIGYRRWKADNVRPFLRSLAREPHFVRNAAAAKELNPTLKDRFIVWGTDVPTSVELLARSTGAKLVRMEDGFIRSVGLGSDFIPPSALVLDHQGLYFDPRQASDLELLLNTRIFTKEDLARAAGVRDMIVSNGLTKYNVEPNDAPDWNNPGRHTILVPGQVEDDASVRYGCLDVRDNLQLLRAAREHAPAAFIVYKPHPDVMANNRIGHLHRTEALEFADAIESHASIVSCIDACDEVHTMTSLSGFDALLRGKPVTTYGMPFYAGWGLTNDRNPPLRRSRHLSLDELIAGALLHYPVYFDASLNGFTTCEATLRDLIRTRRQLLSKGMLSPIRQTRWQRRWNKVSLWAKAGFVVPR